jgi:exoribonuclease R
MQEIIQYAGVLILNGNKTYGRTENKKRLLYRCIPTDKTKAAILVPYEIKLGFSKDIKNKYILFQYTTTIVQEIQIGLISRTLGDIDDFEAYCEYLLYTKHITYSIKELNKKTAFLKFPPIQDQYIQQIIQDNPPMEMRKSAHVFTIDPEGSKDFDDGFSVYRKKGILKGASHTTIKGASPPSASPPTMEGDITIISVYIANVYVWINTLDLLDDINGNIASTIYLPDKKRTMLPAILSDDLCSLQEKKVRFAFAMDFVFCHTTGQIVATEFNYVPCVINVAKNYTYENCIKSQKYQELFDITRILDAEIVDSHNVVEYWMLKMNEKCAEYLVKIKSGIFRRTVEGPKAHRQDPGPKAREQDPGPKAREQDPGPKAREQDPGPKAHRQDPGPKVREQVPSQLASQLASEIQPEIAPEPGPKAHRQVPGPKARQQDLQLFITEYKIGQYINFKENESLRHEILDKSAYVHITSPIRRIVDCVNQMIIYKSLYQTFTVNIPLLQFVLKIQGLCENINTFTKNIRKIQSQCDLLHKYIHHPEILNVKHRGFVFDRQASDKNCDKSKKVKYTVYIFDLKIYASISRLEDEEYININNTDQEFNLYLFENSTTQHRKIRISL